MYVPLPAHQYSAPQATMSRISLYFGIAENCRKCKMPMLVLRSQMASFGGRYWRKDMQKRLLICIPALE
jgi:hypothetical protein